ncbi:MAG: hypothetical protein ACRDGG_12550 [Anaerolineae bacterium]
MDELIKLVSQKVGIPADQAKKAVETVVGFLKDKLPAPIASQIDSLLSGAGGGIADKAKEGLSGLLGKKK